MSPVQKTQYSSFIWGKIGEGEEGLLKFFSCENSLHILTEYINLSEGPDNFKIFNVIIELLTASYEPNPATVPTTEPFWNLRREDSIPEKIDIFIGEHSKRRGVLAAINI